MTKRIIEDILIWADMLNSRLYDHHNHLEVVRPMYRGFTFLTRLPRVRPSLLLTLT